MTHTLLNAHEEETISLFTPSRAYKPFRYPWAYEYWLIHEQMHWLHTEVPLADDVKDFANVLTSCEKNLITQNLRLFTHQDFLVESAYLDLYIPRFKPFEIRMMLSSFASRENIHAVSYSYLIDTLGLPEVEYSAFLEYKEMQAKHEYLQKFNMDTPYNTALSMAVFGAFTEGLQLFASFAMLFNFARFGKMKGMSQIITFSIREETLHVEAIIKLYHALLSEIPSIDREELTKEIISALQEIVENEDRYIDLAFEMGPVEGLTPEEVKQYIRYIGDRRLTQLEIEPIYNIKENPLPWIDELMSGVEHANFFEARSTEYSKASTEGDWGDVFG